MRIRSIYLGVGIFVLPARLSLRQYASDLSRGGKVASIRSGDWDRLPAESEHDTSHVSKLMTSNSQKMFIVLILRR